MSVGDYLRDICTKNSALSEKIQPYLTTETMIPNDLIKQIFNDDILPMVRAEKHPCIIVDGFPRTASQIPDWGVGVPALVFFFDCSKEIAAKRVIERRRGGASPESLAAIFERRYAQHEAENHKIVNHYATMEWSLPVSDDNPYTLETYRAGMDKFILVKIDTSQATEESWKVLKQALKMSLPWNNLIAEIYLHEKATAAFARGYDADDEDDDQYRGEDGKGEDENKGEDGEDDDEGEDKSGKDDDSSLQEEAYKIE